MKKSFTILLGIASLVILMSATNVASDLLTIKPAKPKSTVVYYGSISTDQGYKARDWISARVKEGYQLQESINSGDSVGVIIIMVKY